MSPAVSVCIPAYNAGATIGETIESVLAQTHSDWEILVQDNASPDNTVEVAQSFSDPRIRVEVNDRNYGPVENWNRVVQGATGKYLKLLCADDRIESTCIERQAAVLDDPANVGVVMVACQRNVVDDAGRLVTKGRGLAGMSGRVAGSIAIRKAVQSGTNPMGEGAAVLVRTEHIKAKLPWSGAYPYMIDVEMWLRILDDGDLYALPEPLSVFRVANASWSRDIVRKQRSQAKAFFEEVHDRRPDIITPMDVRRGAAQAALLSQARRGLYWWLDRRSKSSDVKV